MNPLIYLLAIPGIFVFALCIGLLTAWPLLWAWNYVMPWMFGLHALDFWHAYALSCVCSILIKSTNYNKSK